MTGVRSVTAALAAGLALGAASDARAQSSASSAGDLLAPGRTVRITLPARPFALASPRWEGTLRGVAGDSLHVSVAGRDTTFARAHVRVLEVSVPSGDRGRNTWRGAVVGVVLGGAAGFGLGSLFDECSRSAGEAEGICVDDRDLVRTRLTMGGAVALGGLGALLGHFVPTSRWVPVPRDAGRAVGLVAAPGMIGVAARF